MKIIVGLGNPGRKYDATPHNLGFEVADLLSQRLSISFKPSGKEKGLIAEGMIGSEKVVLLKPTTWMNLSGQAVRETIRNRPVELEDLLIVTDDVNLPAGRLRIRAGGSDGGHNGLKSICADLGSADYARLRIGAAPEAGIAQGDLSRYVLSIPPPSERKKLLEAMERAADAAECWVREGVEAAANKFNGSV